MCPCDARYAMIAALIEDVFMRTFLALNVIGLLAVSLSGCAVAEVAGAGVSAATTVVSTTVDVAGDVVSGVADTVSGGSDSDKDKDKDKDKKKPDDDDADK